MRERAVITSRRAIPRTLRDVRVGRGITLPELAASSSLAKATLSQIERGRMVAKPYELQAISDALGVPFENRTLPVTEVAA